MDTIYYPTVIVDGGGYFYGDSIDPQPNGGYLWEGGGTSKWGKYRDDKSDYYVEKGRTTNLTISLTGNITSSQGRVLAHIVATDPITETNLKVRFMVYENNNYRMPESSEIYGHHRVYNHVVKDILPDYDIIDGTFNEGDVLDIERSFTIDASWDLRSLGIAVFVQTENKHTWIYWVGGTPRTRYNAPVLQAATMDFVHSGVLLVDGNDNDNLGDEFDAFDEILTKASIPHHNWDSNETTDSEFDNVRRMPTFSEIQDYSAVIWFTSRDSSTLSDASRSAIGSHLDDKGNLLITGEEIGNDANMMAWTSWYQSYLHATFVNDNAGDSAVDGVLGDPITDGITNMAIVHSSPDIIASSGSTKIFGYSSNPINVAGIRATHDLDSRVVYNAFDYFEATDTEDFDTTEETLMNNMLDWLNLGSAPHVDVLQPDGGEIVPKMDWYEIRWDAKDIEMPETPVTIRYTTDSTSPTWISISTNEPNDGVYLWSTPDVDSTKCRIQVCAVDSVGMSSCAESGADFTLGTPPVESSPPEVSNVLLNGQPTLTVNPGETVTVTATVDDRSTGNSKIGGANYTIDGDWATSTNMEALDGAYDATIEDVTSPPGEIDTIGWTDGSYTICVYGWDSVPNYNTTSGACASLTVTSIPIDNTPPEIHDVLVDGTQSLAVPAGMTVNLTATIVDTESDILIANWTIGPTGPSGNPMSPADGMYDELTEDVFAKIDTTGWPDGSYDLCVYAADAPGNTNSTGACAVLSISSDAWPPEILNVLIDGLSNASYDFSSKPSNFVLTATIDDTNTGNHLIAGANYTIGVAAWPSFPMVAVDFVYNEPTEDVIANAIMPEWPGSYQVCVYAWDGVPNYNLTGGCAVLNIVDDLPPQVLNVLINDSKSTTVLVGDPVYLNATVSDMSTGKSIVVSANYTDGVTNWPSSTPMLAMDGTFNEPLEDVSAFIDTSGWSIGLHTICVYAADSWANYNLSSADCVQLEILAFGPAPPVMLDAQLIGPSLGDLLVSWQRSGDDGTGLDNVVSYELYSSNFYGGPYVLESTIPASDQPTYQYNCSGYGYGDPNNYFFYVKAYNGMEYSPSPNKAAKFVRHLTAGMQLISIPLELSDSSITTVLQTIQFEAVWTYDSWDDIDPWKWYEELKPYRGDLREIDHKGGYWVNVLVDDDLVVAGLVPVVTQIQLRSTWNLVSFPSFSTAFTVADLKAAVGAEKVEVYDPAAPYCLRFLLDSDTLTAGYGYWIYVSADTMWNVAQ